MNTQILTQLAVNNFSDLCDLIFLGLCGIVGIPCKLIFGSYEAGMVAVCIYLWPAICIASVIPTVVASMKKADAGIRKAKPIKWFSFISLVMYVLFTWFTWIAYPVFGVNDFGDPMWRDSFDRCMEAFQFWSKIIGLSYAQLNLIIYVGLFGAINAFWCVMYHITKRIK